jgi:hypothetical protein
MSGSERETRNANPFSRQLRIYPIATPLSSSTRFAKLAVVAVYVDKLIDYGWRHGPSCHLIADSVDELMEFAVAMGLRREWYQPKSSPHFDLTGDGRALAVEMGAIELDNRALVAKLRELRALRKAGAAV